jgi:hypothetical protein
MTKTKQGLALATALFFGAASVASAAPQCYRTNEIEADQAMRYQSKLMVLSDSCSSDSYSQFVRRNAEVISSYQHQLIEHFRRIDRHRPEDEFDRFLTRLANQYALGAGEEKLDSLCAQSAAFLTQAPNFGKDEFRRFVAQQAVDERQSYSRCEDEQSASSDVPRN